MVTKTPIFPKLRLMWDGGMVGWWDGGMVGGMVGWWDGGDQNSYFFQNQKVYIGLPSIIIPSYLKILYNTV